MDCGFRRLNIRAFDWGKGARSIPRRDIAYEKKTQFDFRK